MGRPQYGHTETGFEHASIHSFSSTGSPSDWSEALDIIDSGVTPEHVSFFTDYINRKTAFNSLMQICKCIFS